MPGGRGLARPSRGNEKSEFWRSLLLMLKISPKLLRPVVEIEFRPEARLDEELCGSSSLRAASISEFKVDDRPRVRRPLLDVFECADVVESLRKRCGGFIAFGDDNLTED